MVIFTDFYLKFLKTLASSALNSVGREWWGERGSLPLLCFNCPIHLIFICKNIVQMIDSLTEKLEKREIQLLSTSKEKARLEEAYDNLKE